MRSTTPAPDEDDEGMKSASEPTATTRPTT
jgi:hypothetical protein